MTGATITPADRLSLAVFFAVVLHALAIFGVGFSDAAPRPAREAPLIEITLADNPIELEVDDYDYLAQANQDGGGDSEEKQRPRKSEQALMAGEPDGQQQLQAAPAPAPSEQTRQQQLITTDGADERTAQSAADAPAQTEPLTVELVNAAPQAAPWAAIQDSRRSVLAKFPSKQRIDARTKSHAAAAYMHEWQEKVERIGNLNLPEETRRRQLSGSLILELTLRPDGSVHEIRVLRPSEHRVLDLAAMRTVRLAAPFAPVPEAVLQGNDLLVITRTWEFVGETGLSTR
jgi:protein TonB